MGNQPTCPKCRRMMAVQVTGVSRRRDGPDVLHTGHRCQNQMCFASHDTARDLLDGGHGEPVDPTSGYGRR